MKMQNYQLLLAGLEPLEYKRPPFASYRFYGDQMAFFGDRGVVFSVD